MRTERPRFPARAHQREPGCDALNRLPLRRGRAQLLGAQNERGNQGPQRVVAKVAPTFSGVNNRGQGALYSQKEMQRAFDARDRLASLLEADVRPLSPRPIVKVASTLKRCCCDIDTVIKVARGESFLSFDDESNAVRDNCGMSRIGRVCSQLSLRHGLAAYT